MKVPDLFVGKRLFVGCGNPEALGRGDAEIRGSAYIEGPEIVGNPIEFPTVNATLMVGPLINNESPLKPLYSLWVRLNARFQDFVRVDSLLKATNIEAKTVKTDVLLAKKKNFLIDHPTKKGKKLVHSCLEGPENGVYIRGKIVNNNIIDLPEYWTKLVDDQSITVSLTPIGAHQDIIVKGIVDNKVFLQSKSGIPINCFYHIFGTRQDLPNLITEIDE